MYVIFELEFALTSNFTNKNYALESEERSRVIIIINDILTILYNFTFVELYQERIKYLSGNWMNLACTPTLREVNQINSQGTAHQNKQTVKNRAKLMLSYHNPISSRRKKSFLGF